MMPFLKHTLRGKTNAKDGIPLIQMLLLEKLMLQGGGQAYPPILFAHWEMSARDYDHDSQPKTLKSEREYPGTTCFLGWPSLWHIVFALCLYHVSKFGSRNFRPSTSHMKLYHPKHSLLRTRHMQLLGCPTSQSHSWEEDGGTFANTALSTWAGWRRTLVANGLCRDSMV